MKFNFKAKTKYEKFAEKIYFLLVDNFSQTFFVGGSVRDLLIKKKIKDIDIATSATPIQVLQLLTGAHILTYKMFEQQGVIIVPMAGREVAIATFRRDLSSRTRYPRVKFITSAKEDSKRRDFTINSLYLSLNSQEIIDFHHGIKDLDNKTISFIGNPEKKIHQDPLRILRALRFALELEFTFERKTFLAIKKNFKLVQSLTYSRVEKEKNKLTNEKNKKTFQNTLDTPEVLDKYFK